MLPQIKDQHFWENFACLEMGLFDFEKTSNNVDILAFEENKYTATYLLFFGRFEPTVFCNRGAFYRIWQTILCIFERKIFSIVRTVGILIHIKKDTSNTIWIFWHHLTSILYGTPLIMIPNSERSDIGNRIFGYNYQPKKEVKR